MQHFIFILTNIIVPIFIQIAIGFVMQKKFSLNINTLAKVQFYVFIPALLFVKVYEAEVSRGLFFSVMLNSFLLFCILYGISWITARIFKFSRPASTAFINSVGFYNSGNYCLPLIQLLYNNPFAFSVQIIIMMTQNIITNTVGIFNTNVGSKSVKHALLEVLRIPMGYGVIAALVIKLAGAKVWAPVWNSLDILGQGMVPIALFTLGAQLANTRFSFNMPRVYLSNLIRLVISPLIAYGVCFISGIQGIAAQVVIIASAAPTAVNSVLLAIEYDNEPEFASQSVFSSTVFSAITVSAVIYLVTKYL